MKQHRIFIFLFVYTLFLSSSFAEDVTQWQVLKDNEMPVGSTTINAITFSPNGTRLAVASVNGITVYDTYTGEVLTLLPSLISHVTALAFSADSRIVAIAYEDATVHLQNTHTGEHICLHTHCRPLSPLLRLTAFYRESNVSVWQCCASLLVRLLKNLRYVRSYLPSWSGAYSCVTESFKQPTYSLGT